VGDIAELANSREELTEMQAKTITYNGEQLTEFDASQKQRTIERQIRHWKRECKGMEYLCRSWKSTF